MRNRNIWEREGDTYSFFFVLLSKSTKDHPETRFCLLHPYPDYAPAMWSVITSRMHDVTVTVILRINGVSILTMRCGLVDSYIVPKVFYVLVFLGSLGSSQAHLAAGHALG